MNEAKNDNPKKQLPIHQVILRFLGEIVVPTTVGILIWYLFAYLLKLWRLSSVVNFSIFVSIVVAVSFFINRTIFYAQKHKNKTRGIISAIVSVIIIPFIVSVLANTVPVSGNDTILTVTLRRLMGREDYYFIKNIGDTVISSDDSRTKAEGIHTLTLIHTELTLQELFRILDSDDKILYDYNLYQDLSRGIASYDSLARGRLVVLFHQNTSKTEGTPRGLNLDLYSNFFDNSFVGLEKLLTDETADPETLELKLLELEKSKTQLKETLVMLGSERNNFVNPTLNFVLDTFLEMNKLQYDPEIYSLAKTIAADSTYAEGTRSSAILLVAKLGDKEDFDFFVSYLNNKSEVLRAAALRGIGILHTKLSPSKAENSKPTPQ